jgi:hypothetical protein
MLTGYFDESGTHDDALVTSVAGIIATTEGWMAFDQAWTKVLAHWGLSYFHMKECAHCTGDFEQFRDNEAGRKQLLGLLAIVICQHCEYGCGASVICSDHRQYARDERMGSPYSTACFGCIVLADQWMTATEQSGPLDLVLENGCKYSSDLLRQLEHHERPLGTLRQFGTITLGPKKDSPRLQAADFLAYELGKHITECVKRGEAVPVRTSLHLLQAAIPYNFKVFDAHILADLLIEINLRDILALDRATLLRLDPNAKIDDNYQPTGKILLFPGKQVRRGAPTRVT